VDVTRLSAGGLTVELPQGWEAEIDAGAPGWSDAESGQPIELLPATQPDGAVRRVVAHLANFPLPPGRGDFGSGAVEAMRPGDALVVLFEYEPESTATALFHADGLPVIAAADFSPAGLQKPLPGGSAVQRFFSIANRAFCLYVVVGSHIDRADVVPVIADVLEGIEVT
jgi:hypothetical protein